MGRATRWDKAAAESETLDQSLLVGHFAAGRCLPVVPDGWESSQLGGWTLARHPSLSAHELTDASDVAFGWLLGEPVDVATHSPVSSFRVPWPVGDPRFADRFEDWLFAFGGRFAAVLPPPVGCAYLDAYGSIPIVYRRETEVAASSPFLLARGDETLRRTDLAAALDVDRTGLWFILGTTPYAGVDRLVPNHVLDLKTWDQRRHWPRDPIETGQVAELTERIADAVEGVIHGVASRVVPNISLTAGGDTRLLLACSRSLLDRVSFFTVSIRDDLGKIDLHTAPALAARFGLDYRVLEWVPSSRADIDVYRYRTGGLIAVGAFTRPEPRTYAQLGRDRPYVSGVGGVTGVNGAELNVGERDGETSRLSADDVLRRFAFHPSHPELVARTERWLDQLPRADPFNTMQLFHVEMYYGCWGGAIAMGYPDACSSTVYPYGQRAVVESMLRLPFGYRMTGAARRDMIGARWPELLEVKFNEPPFAVALRRGIRRGVVRARRRGARTVRKALARSRANARRP